MEKLLDWMGLTCILLAIIVAIIIVESWNHGRDYVIKDNFAKRLNVFEKWVDGFITFLKL